MLVHAQEKWPGVIDDYLWPYSICMANDITNQIPRLDEANTQKGKSPIQQISRTEVNINLTHWHTFGAP